MRARTTFVAAIAAVALATAPLEAQYGPTSGNAYTGPTDVTGIWRAGTATLSFDYLFREATLPHQLWLIDPETMETVAPIFVAPDPDTPEIFGRTITVTPGKLYMLGLFVENTGFGPAWYYSNGASTADPAMIDEEGGIVLGAYRYTFSGEGYRTVLQIEDRRMGVSDRDTNDMIVAVTNTPEPISMALLGSGLAAMGGLGAARRRRAQQG